VFVCEVVDEESGTLATQVAFRGSLAVKGLRRLAWIMSFIVERRGGL